MLATWIRNWSGRIWKDSKGNDFSEVLCQGVGNIVALTNWVLQKGQLFLEVDSEPGEGCASDTESLLEEAQGHS